MPTAVLLSQWTSLMIFVCCVLRNKEPISTSAVDAATSFRMTHKSWMDPFSLMGSFGFGSHPRK
jgi:hypothetical protein